jgi:HSP20 family molecular chaperone IbpA
MKKNNYLDLITAVDVLNTLNGGMSEPQMSIQQGEEAREIRLRIPGTSKEAVNVEVHNNTLTIYHFIPVPSQDKIIEMPRIVYSRVIPYFIDISKIHAHVEVEELVVELPFNRLANGYHRHIRIRED